MAEQALSYKGYLATLPPDRRAVVQKVWQLVRKNIPAGYTEHIGPRFLAFTAGDLWYVALANQKNYISLYLMPVYAFPALKKKLEGSGKKLKTGKSCINFKRVEELPLEAIAEIVGFCEGEDYIAYAQRLWARSKVRKKSG